MDKSAILAQALFRGSANFPNINYKDAFEGDREKEPHRYVRNRQPRTLRNNI